MNPCGWLEAEEFARPSSPPFASPPAATLKLPIANDGMDGQQQVAAPLSPTKCIFCTLKADKTKAECSRVYLFIYHPSSIIIVCMIRLFCRPSALLLFGGCPSPRISFHPWIVRDKRAQRLVLNPRKRGTSAKICKSAKPTYKRSESKQTRRSAGRQMRPPGSVVFADQIAPHSLQQQNGSMERHFLRQPGHQHLTPSPMLTSKEMASSRRGGAVQRTDSNGTRPPHNGGSNQQRCHCCPYGFHIDLGFVKFAEDVAAGKEQIQNWSSPAKKRARRLLASPSSDRTMLDLSLATTDDGPNNNNSSLNDASLLSKSIETDEVPELPDFRTAQLQHQQQHFVPQSILKNASNGNGGINEWNSAGNGGALFSNVPSHTVTGYTRSVSEHQMDAIVPLSRGQQQHQSRFHQVGAGGRSAGHCSSASAPSPPIGRRYPLSVAYENGHQHLAAIGSPLRTSTPRSVNDEIQQILEQRPLHLSTGSVGHRGHHHQNGGGSGVSSAPSSPVPKTFHTAIAQSLAQMRRAPSKGTASATWSVIPQAHTSLSALSGPARSAFHAAGLGCPVSSAPHSMRRHHLERGGRRQRVLSPEPQLPLPTMDQQPMALRKSNLQSRAFFHANNSTADSAASLPRVAYRSRGGAPTPTLDLFASVRRRRLDTASELGGADSPSFSSAVPSSVQLVRSLSPPPIPSPSLFFPSQPPQSYYQLLFSAAQSPVGHPQTPPIGSLTKTESRVPCAASSVVHTATVVRNSGTQTALVERPTAKEVGIGTEEAGAAAMREMGTSPMHAFELFQSHLSIGVDTNDLVPKKASPPPPPPKPTGPTFEAELERRRGEERRAKMGHLVAEFQYCLGHEPEHRPGEEPQFLEQQQRREVTVETESRPIMTERGTDAFCAFSVLTQCTSTTGLNNVAPAKSDAIVGTEQIRREEKATRTEEGDGVGGTAAAEVQTVEGAETSAVGTQTDAEWLETMIGGRLAQAETERREKRKRHSVERGTETDEEELGSDQFIMITCNKCEHRSSVAGDELFEKIVAPDEGHRQAADTEAEQQPEPAPHQHSISPTASLPLAECLVTISEEDEEVSEEAASRMADSGERKGLQQHMSPLSSDEGLVLGAEDEEEAGLESAVAGEDIIDVDRVSIETDLQTVICVEQQHIQRPGSSASDGATDGRTIAALSAAARTEALRKMLTEPQRFQQPFQRNAGSNRSYRTEKGRANDLEYITERHKSGTLQKAEPSTPCSSSGALAPHKALKETISLKKNPQFAGASIGGIPDPIPARIPRPKFARYSPNVAQAETADEEEEAADRLTPLRSEMRALSSSLWSGSPRMGRALIFRTPIGEESDEAEEEGELFERRIEAGEVAMEDTSSTSSEGARTYEMSEDESADFELSSPLRDALETINVHLQGGIEEEQDRTEERRLETEWAYKYGQHEWLKLATKKNANAELVEQFIDALETYSTPLMSTVVNITDQNGNTALHYAVSNENFDVVSVLLDSKVCRVDEMNKAGYSALMLGALCELRNETECAIIQRLFQMGNVNAKAVKHAQTALMLAASHGRVETTNLLLNCGADVNIQDVDGSTALMCAAEHGQKEIVKILLKRLNIDASLTDCDNQTALSIAVENQHRDIGVLIYAHLNFSRLDQNENAVAI